MSADEIDYSLQWNSNDSQLNILGNFKNANADIQGWLVKRTRMALPI